MIELRVLGTLDLQDPDNGDLGGVLARPKLVALLVYLTLTRPNGFRSRETLLGLFWPESSQTKARRALNQSLYELRKALGEGVVVSRGAEDVGVDPARIWCDAVAFDNAVGNGDRSRALELYGGDLLSGFAMPGCADFETWLDEAREERRRGALRTARERANELIALDNGVEAVFWLRRALRWEPYDEKLLARLLDQLVALGDDVGALREYEAFEALMDQDLGVAPSRKIRSRIDGIRRRRREEMDPDPASAVSPDERASGAGRPAPPARRVARADRRWRSRRTIGVAALVGVAGIGLLTTLASRSGREAIAEGSGNRIAVFPFVVRGDEGAAYLGEGMVDLLSMELTIPGEISVVDSRVLLGAIGEGSTASHEPSEAGRIASDLGAEMFVMGTIVEAGGRFRIDAALYGVDGRQLSRTQVPVDTEEEIFGAVSRVARDLVAELYGSDEESVRTVAATTSSLPALKAYLLGERKLREGRFAESVEFFQRAVEHDPTFALGYYRLSVAANWAGRGDVFPIAATAAWERRDGLPEADRLVLESQRAAYGTHDYAETERLLRLAVSRHPGHLDARYQLAELYFHNGHWGIGPAAQREGYEKVLEIDPWNQESMLHLVRLAAVERDPGQIDSLTRRALALRSDGEYATEILALRAFSVGAPSERNQSLMELRRLDDEVLVKLAFQVVNFTGELERARPVMRLLTEPQRSTEVRTTGWIGLAFMDAGSGRLGRARDELGRAGELDPATAARAAALLEITRPSPSDEADLERLRGLVAQGAGRREASFHASGGETLWVPTVRPLLLGLIDAGLGTRERALAQGDSLMGNRGGERAEGAARLVRAAVARADGRRADALAELSRDPRGFSTDPAGLGVFLRAELLRESGRDREALEFYGAQIEGLPYRSLFLARSHLRRAEAHDRLGERQAAMRHYARFVELWRDADPELQPMVEGARRRLAALRS